MGNIRELKKKLKLLESSRDKLLNDYKNKCLQNIPIEIAWKWYCNQPIVKECETIEREILNLS